MSKIYILKNKKTGKITVKEDTSVNQFRHEALREYDFTNTRLLKLKAWSKEGGVVERLDEVVKDADETDRRYYELRCAQPETLDEFLSVKAEEMRLKPVRDEVVFMNKLKEAGIAYEHQKEIAVQNVFGDAKGFIMDFFLPEYNCCIEIDGFSHETSKSYNTDSQKSYYLHIQGIPVVRINSNFLKHINKENIRSVIENGIDQVKDFYKEIRPNFNEVVDKLLKAQNESPRVSVTMNCGFLNFDDGGLMRIAVSLIADPAKFGRPILKEEQIISQNEDKEEDARKKYLESLFGAKKAAKIAERIR